MKKLLALIIVAGIGVVLYMALTGEGRIFLETVQGSSVVEKPEDYDDFLNNEVLQFNKTVYASSYTSRVENLWLYAAFADPNVLSLDLSYENVRDQVVNEKGTYDIAYTLTKDKLKQQQKYLDLEIERFKKSLSSDLSEESQIQYIHDYLCGKCKHGEGKKESEYTAYGALVEGSAMCQGYAKAFKLLLDAAGLTGGCVTGNLDDTQGHVGGIGLYTDIDREWNWVKCGSLYYFVDAYLDDAGTEISHSFMMVSADTAENGYNTLVIYKD